jgi:GNAT superfamily N-acetyltransferase
MSLIIRPIQESDCTLISEAFMAQGWDKPVSQYHYYYQLQEAGARDVLIAALDGQFAGYLTIVWESGYAPFREQQIPEVVDFNVLMKFRRQGIGTALMDEAERRIAGVAGYAGIGVGLLADYGAAQALYARRGYVPDGRGVHLDGRTLKYGDEVVMGDDLVLSLRKNLGVSN